jgi:hypothetical protein
MFGDQAGNGRAVVDQRLERQSAMANCHIGNGGEQNDHKQGQQRADRTARLVGWGDCGHPRYIHEPAAQTAGLTAL